MPRCPVSRAVRRHIRDDELKDWTPHDLRRTASTQMSNIGIMPHIVEKILNHSMQGVMAVYNRSEYLPEKMEAMKIWSEKVKKLLEDKKEKVVPLKKKSI